jgi:spore maturation protein CgeB
MKILYVAMKYDYGIPERGLSFEHYNFYDPLRAMGHELEYFDFYTLFQAHGRDKMTRMLKERVGELKPDLMFTFLYSDQFDPAILRSITEEKKTITFNWFADDHWRFDEFSRHWAPCFTYVSTTDIDAIAKYKAIGYANALLTQWAANPNVYKKGDGTVRHGVTFVGQAYGDRPQLIRSLARCGIGVEVKGTYWNVRRWHEYARKFGLLSSRKFEELAHSTRTSQQEMVALFQSSRINLNLSAASQQRKNQIKGRNFEIPSCGGFQLSGYADRLEEYFELDKEIVCYSGAEELVDKVRYYLDHEDERAAIAEAGFRRVMREHTYEKRFTDLFRRMQLL